TSATAANVAKDVIFMQREGGGVHPRGKLASHKWHLIGEASRLSRSSAYKACVIWQGPSSLKSFQCRHSAARRKRDANDAAVLTLRDFDRTLMALDDLASHRESQSQSHIPRGEKGLCPTRGRLAGKA